MNISEHFQIETSTVAGLETRTNTLIPFRYVMVKFRCVVMVVGGVRGWGGGGDGVGHKSKPRDRGILLLKITFVNFTGFGLA